MESYTEFDRGLEPGEGGGKGEIYRKIGTVPDRVSMALIPGGLNQCLLGA